MQHLLLLDYFRGTDSTGLAAVRTNGEVHIAKLAEDPITLFQMSKFKAALNGNTSKLFLGHNRASTSGSTSNYNAHPYQFGHITGVQNGTLEFKDKMLLEDVVGERFEVDSQALFACIAKIGVKDTVEMLTEGEDGVRGAWALVWYDQKEDTINFLRNQHRPLWLGWEKGYQRLFFGSLWQFLDHAGATTHATPYEWAPFESKDKPGHTYRFFTLPENKHLKFNLDEIRKGSETRPKPIVRDIKGKEPQKAPTAFRPPVYDPFRRNGRQLGVHSNSNSNNKTKNSSTTPSLGSNRNGERLIHVFGTDEAPYSLALGMVRFSELVQVGHTGHQVGCSWCYADIGYGDPGITVYEQQDTILCAKCSGHEGDDMPAAKVYVSKEDFATLQKAA